MVLWSNGEDNLPDVLCCEIFGFLDPTAVSISHCELASRELYEVSCSMRTMWRWMLGKSYGLWVDDDCDARAVHRYVTKLYSSDENDLIDCSVIFSDDGTPYPDYLPEYAMRDNRQAWCTHPGVKANVDLVARVTCSVPHLVTSVEVRTPGCGFSNPVLETLAWLSFDAPDVAARRVWDGTDPESITLEPNQIAVSCSDIPARTIGSAPGHPATPIVSRFVHFKILNSRHSESERANIDVGALLIRGVPLPELERVMGQPIKLGPDPSYERFHAKGTRLRGY